ncbi:MAG: tetrahydrofolate dehydrogenase/cyclohydrolase catalytic domain-containing protein, partial [Patescibacteria group bacterium]
QSNSSVQASLSFLKQKEKVAKELGIDFRIYEPEHTKYCVLGRAHTSQCMCSGFQNDSLRKFVLKIANLKKVGGVIVQLPLPEHLNKHYILNVIPREKDIDVLGERALGAFYNGRNIVLPPAVEVVKEIIENCKLKIENLRIAVVGAGFLIGKPIAVWLMNQKVKELTIFEKGSLPAQAGDLTELKDYDLIISGTGVAGLIKLEMLKQGAGIIDFGYSMGKELGIMNNELGIKIRGDLDVSDIQNSKFKIQNSGFYTPTPGGTGPILVAKIFENFYNLNNEKIKRQL